LVLPFLDEDPNEVPQSFRQLSLSTRYGFSTLLQLATLAPAEAEQHLKTDHDDSAHGFGSVAPGPTLFQPLQPHSVDAARKIAQQYVMK